MYAWRQAVDDATGRLLGMPFVPDHCEERGTQVKTAVAAAGKVSRTAGSVGSTKYGSDEALTVATTSAPPMEAAGSSLESGVPSVRGYFGTPFWVLVKRRSSWLVSLLFLQSASSLILQRYEGLISQHLVVALFLTMIIGTAGNAGNQATSAVIAGLGSRELRARRDCGRVLRRELRAGAVSGAMLAATAFLRVVAAAPGGLASGALAGGTTGAYHLAAAGAVALSMFLTVFGAVVVGTLAPFLLEFLGVDPTNGSSPALATLTDITGVLILCSVSSRILQVT